MAEVAAGQARVALIEGEISELRRSGGVPADLLLALGGIETDRLWGDLDLATMARTSTDRRPRGQSLLNRAWRLLGAGYGRPVARRQDRFNQVLLGRLNDLEAQLAHLLDAPTDIGPRELGGAVAELLPAVTGEVVVIGVAAATLKGLIDAGIAVSAASCSTLAPNALDQVPNSLMAAVVTPRPLPLVADIGRVLRPGGVLIRAGSDPVPGFVPQASARGWTALVPA